MSLDSERAQARLRALAVRGFQETSPGSGRFRYIGISREGIQAIMRGESHVNGDPVIREDSIQVETRKRTPREPHEVLEGQSPAEMESLGTIYDAASDGAKVPIQMLESASVATAARFMRSSDPKAQILGAELVTRAIHERVRTRVEQMKMRRMQALLKVREKYEQLDSDGKLLPGVIVPERRRHEEDSPEGDTDR